MNFSALLATLNESSCVYGLNNASNIVVKLRSSLLLSVLLGCLEAESDSIYMVLIFEPFSELLRLYIVERIYADVGLTSTVIPESIAYFIAGFLSGLACHSLFCVKNTIIPLTVPSSFFKLSIFLDCAMKNSRVI